MSLLQLAPGSLFANRFEIQRAAGSGGMGTVYRALDRYTGGSVALKLLHSASGDSAEGARFAREAQLLSELHHPGIVAHAAHGQTPDGQRFLAMEWLEGHDLGERLRRGPLTVRDSLHLVEQVADALAAAHQRGIIHRDLKPSNLFLVGGDVARVKLLDFGIARRMGATQAMTRTGMVVGTPEYMSPEQARGSRDLSPAADLFSLGCVLYECLTGQPPFVADHIAAVLVRILFEQPVPIQELRLGISPLLATLTARLLAKAPEQRYADAAALRRDLVNLGELPEPSLALTMAGPAPKAESFAEQEQSLFSIVLAAANEEEIGLGATQTGGDAQLAAASRQALLSGIAGLGGAADFLANGTLVVTVPPLGSAQDQATQAARAALLIKEHWPDAIVSMATGRGAVRGRTAVGEVVEQAARSLKTASRPAAGTPTSGVIADALSAKLLTGRFAQRPHPGGAVLLYEEREVDTSRPLLGRPTPCVGREAELGALESQLAACIEESEARVVLFSAPPGTGKSRLRHEFIRRLQKRSEPLTVMIGRGDMTSAGAPYGILRPMLHKLCDLSASDPIETQRERLQRRIAQNVPAADAERVLLFVGELCRIPFPEEGRPMLQAARQDPAIMRECLRRAFLDLLAAECKAAPVLLLLDDLQWGDELTVSLLDQALREQSNAPLLILCFARPEVRELFPHLWPAHKVQEMPLKALSRKACERLIAHVLGQQLSPEVVTRAIEQSAGNALFLEEIIRSLAEGQSEVQSATVVAMLQARLGRLDGSLRRIVRAAAVFGQTFWTNGVAEILGLAQSHAEVQDALVALVAEELILPHDNSRLPHQSEYAFRHALVRDAAYSLLTENDVRAGHRLAGRFLVTAGEPSSAIIGEHFELGGELLLAAQHYLRAAEESLGRGDYAGAQQRAERGLRCAPDGLLLGQLHGVVCKVAFSLNRYDGVRESAAVALRLLPPGSLGWCRAVHGALYAALGRQDPGEMFASISLLLSTEPEAEARSAYIEALGYVSPGLVVAAPLPVMEALAARLVPIVELASRENPTIRRYLHMHESGMAGFRSPRPWFALQQSREMVRLSHEAGDRRSELAFLAGAIGYGWLGLGAREEAEKFLLSVEKQVAQSQEGLFLALWRHNLAWVLTEAPDEDSWDRAAQLAALLQTETSGLLYIPLFGQGILARVALLKGRFAEAEQRAGGVMQLFSMMPLWLTRTASVQIRALLALGRNAEATAVAETVLAALPALGGAGQTEVELRLACSEAFRAAGHDERAVAELRETLRQISLRADDIPDPVWKNSYLTRNPSCVRAREVAREWGI